MTVEDLFLYGDCSDCDWDVIDCIYKGHCHYEEEDENTNVQAY